MNENTILISVIIPVYNSGNFLKSCLESVVNQKNFSRFEIICVDDASNDNSAEIILSMAKQYRYIKYIKNDKNIGVSASRNIGLRNAVGKYIMFVDSDDLLNCNAMSMCYSVAENNNTDLLCFNATFFTKDYSFSFIPAEHVELLKYIDKGYPEYLAYITNIWLLFYRRSYIVESGIEFSNKKVFEDWEFLWKLYAGTTAVKFIDRSLYYYRVGMNPLSLTDSFKKRRWGFDLLYKNYFDSINGFIKKNNLQSYEYVCLQRTCAIFYEFFIETKQSYKKMAEDIRWFSFFLKSFPEVLIKKIISDGFWGAKSLVIKAIYRNTVFDRVFLFSFVGSGAGNYIYTAISDLNIIIQPIKQFLEWTKRIFRIFMMLSIATYKIIKNILKKLGILNRP